MRATSLYARKIAQIAESRRHLRRDCGALTYRRPKKRPRKLQVKQKVSISRHRPLFLMMLFFVSQYFFLQSPLFEHQTISVNGNESLSLSTVEERLGVKEGMNFWELSESSLEENLKALHLVDEARVSLVFPGEVRVNVSERKPSFFVAQKTSAPKWFSADQDGVVLKSAAPKDDALKIFLPHPVKDGTKVRTDDLQVVRYFQDRLSSNLRSSVRAIEIDQGQQLSLKTMVGKDPVWVKLGRAERLEYKLFLLSELITQLGKEQATILSIDLRFSAPVVKKKVVQTVATE